MIRTFILRHALDGVDEVGVISENDQLSEREESRMDGQCPVTIEGVLRLATSIYNSFRLLAWSVRAMSTTMLAFRFMTSSPPFPAYVYKYIELNGKIYHYYGKM